MARNRMIKPEFWTNEKVISCSIPARLLFIGLWNFSDDSGGAHGRLRELKMKIYPADDFTADDIHGMLTELSVNRLITIYDVDGEPYIQIIGWHHQTINRPTSSHLPPPEQGRSLNHHGALSEDSRPKERIRKERKGREDEVYRVTTTKR